MPLAPRLLSKKKAAAYCGLSLSGFDDWRRRGLLPGPIPGTNRWDVRLLDKALDKLSGLSQPDSLPTPQNAYDEWKRQSETAP
jgi:hypothetical protein